MKTSDLTLLLLITFCVGNTAFSQEVSFTRDIRPILSDKCFHCHGNDENTREAGLRLDIRDDAIDMDAIVPESLEDSNAWQRIISEEEDEIMPPPRSHKSLSDKEKQLIRTWIKQGAAYEQHWAYRPVKKPEVALGSEFESPIDALIQKSLKEHNLLSAGKASRETLIRRLSLDLTGLPPTFEELERFVNDTSENAYEKLVDQLLSQDAFGERMAVFWLDLVRYADTVGYHADNKMEVSAYRDYVINAFNSNKPFDEFTIEQLAGDLLPNATEEQKIASGYNRLLQTTEEGGAQPKEYIAIYAADRVRNVSGVWMGQTMGCAQCHDHKYDPITAKDFYAMSAFFADIRETPVGKRAVNMRLYTDDEKAKLKSLEEKLTAAKDKETEFRNGSDARKSSQAEWESNFLESADMEDTQWLVPEVSNVTASAGKLEELGDGSLLITGSVPKSSNYELDILTRQKIAAIRLEALTDASFTVKDGYSTGNGNLVLTGFEVLKDGTKVKIASAKADFAQNDYPAEHAIDEVKESGWAVGGHTKRDGRRAIIFRFDEPLEPGEQGLLNIRLLHESAFPLHHIGRFRLSIAKSEDPAAELSFDGKTAPPEKMGQLIRIEKDKRTPEQQKQIDEAFLDGSKELKAFVSRKKELESEIKKTRDGARTMLVADALPTPRMTKIKNRGDWMDESGEVVQPAVPEFLPSNFDGDSKLTRLDLANWLVEPSNPLTSRTFVNRVWKVFFGRGLSKNLDDLGGQGEPPTHPELLDWLAADFQKDWNVKKAIKAIVMTEAYRCSSIAAKEVVSSDPENRWYARQGRWRIDAEFVRDTALRLSGLLDESQIGGRSVKPYQPEGYWQHLNFPKRKWKHDSGTKLYRKSLYTFWCRSFLHPSMLAFDAPTREECVASRARSNIPQQALVLLNDPIFVEASRGFALRMMQSDGETQEKVRRGWQEAVGRKPAEDEIKLLVGLFEKQKKRFAESGQDAEALLQIGESAIPDGIKSAELAAWTQVARAILNAYETISRH